MITPENTTIILCSPEGEANMGAVARSMVCFGLSDLVLVTPRKQPGVTARNWSCHGLPVLEACRFANSLDEALTGINLAFAFTRRSGKRRHKLLSLPELHHELDAHPEPGRIALVFGNEESGLSNDELEGCHRLVTIPSLGSLNLAHSVSLAVYELFGRDRNVPGEKPLKLASPERRRQLMQTLTAHLQSMGYPWHKASLTEEMTKFGDILDRARLEEWEINFMGGMFKHLKIKFEQLSENLAKLRDNNQPNERKEDK